MSDIIIREDSPFYGVVKELEETPERQFKGVWIEAEIWLNTDLSWLEKCLWAEISCLGTEKKPCFASNAYLARVMDSTEGSIANMISRMRKMGFIKTVSFDGRKRFIRAVTSNGDFTQTLGETSRSGEPCHNAPVNIVTRVVTRVENRGHPASPTAISPKKQTELELSEPITSFPPCQARGEAPSNEPPHCAAPPKFSQPTADEFVKAWNGMVVFPTIADFTDSRRKQFKDRTKSQFWCENWREALRRMSASPFHLGENDRGWKANVDFFLKPNTVTKMIERDKETSKPSKGMKL